MKEITVTELGTMLHKLGNEITKILEVTEYDRYEDWSCIKNLDKITDPNELQDLDEYQTVMRHLCDINNTLNYQRWTAITDESVLSVNAHGNYEDEYHEYHCGDSIEYYFYDDWDEKYKWRTSRIEHNGKRYYIVSNPNLELDGLRVRHRIPF